jgi:hypothetical protein
MPTVPAQIWNLHWKVIAALPPCPVDEAQRLLRTVSASIRAMNAAMLWQFVPESWLGSWEFGGTFPVIVDSGPACCRVATSSLGLCRSDLGNERPGRCSGAGLVHAQVHRSPARRVLPIS